MKKKLFYKRYHGAFVVRTAVQAEIFVSSHFRFKKQEARRKTTKKYIKNYAWIDRIIFNLKIKPKWQWHWKSILFCISLSLLLLTFFLSVFGCVCLFVVLDVRIYKYDVCAITIDFLYHLCQLLHFYTDPMLLCSFIYFFSCRLHNAHTQYTQISPFPSRNFIDNT